MSGVKGRSGRRTKSEEQKRRDTLQKAWDLTYQQLHNTNEPRRFDTAAQMVIKDMVNKEKIQMDANITEEEKQIIDRYIQHNRLPADSTDSTN